MKYIVLIKDDYSWDKYEYQTLDEAKIKLSSHVNDYGGTLSDCVLIKGEVLEIELQKTIVVKQ